MSHSNIRRHVGGLCIVSALGCAGETVDLGGGRVSQDIQRSTACSESPVFVGSVRARDQAELQALAGCEEITGDLRVEAFVGADLSPLSSLRSVGGLLELGAFPLLPDEGVDSETLDALLQQYDDAVASGYLRTLQGLENLERAAALDLYSVAAEDLTPLAGLRELTGRSSLPYGFLGIHDTQLRTLRGLENLQGIEHLVLSDNRELESLGGITLDEELGNVNLVGCPQLASIAELAPLVVAFTLHLGDVGITDLDALENLYFVESAISLTGNRLLANVDRLAAVTTESLFINDNAALRSIPPLPNMSYLEDFMAIGNPALETIDLRLPVHGGGPTFLRGESLVDPIDVIDIGDNAALTRVSLTDGLAEGRFVAIYDNPALERVALGTLTRLDGLTLDANPSLSLVELGALETVESLSVKNNPALPTPAFAALRTFESVLDGNAP